MGKGIKTLRMLFLVYTEFFLEKKKKNIWKLEDFIFGGLKFYESYEVYSELSICIHFQMFGF